MRKLKWWFALVGIWYLLLVVFNIYMMFLSDWQSLAAMFPFPGDENVVRAFVDGWSPFLFEMFGIATFALWATRDPGKYAPAALLLIWLEFTHGVLDDIYLIARGYDAASYLAFIAIHLLIIVSGYVFVRQAQTEALPAPQPAAS